MNERATTITRLWACLLAVALIGVLPAASAEAQTGPGWFDASELYTVPSGGTAEQLAYSATHDVLFTRQDGGIYVIDVATKANLGVALPVGVFSDLSVSPSGDYLFAADYGGTNIGYGTPYNPSYVYRYDIANDVWDSAVAPSIAYRIEAVSDTRFLLLEQDQFVDATLNEWGAGIVELDRSAYNFYLTAGDIEYDPDTGTMFHGNSGSSSREITTAQVVGNQLNLGTSTGVYGSAQNGGGSMVLSSDAERLFYGRLQVDAADVTANQLQHSSFIAAATNDIAWAADGKRFRVSNGSQLDPLPFVPDAIVAPRGMNEVWIALPGGTEVARCVIDQNLGCKVGSCAGLEVTGPIGTPGDDVLVGTSGADVINGAGGNDVICGLGGNDRIIGGAGNDLIFGQDGNDYIWGGDGIDEIHGGAGMDRVRAGAGDDVIYGGPDRDVLLGDAGVDDLYGEAGRDSLHGGDGNDLVDGGDDTDLVRGEDGDDILYTGPSGNDRLVGGDGADSFYGQATTGSTRMIGEGGNDVFYGSNQLDRMWGGAGDDILFGRGYNDLLRGGAGNDSIYGESGRDTLDGGTGDDFLHGGSGNSDRMVGMAGFDMCDGAGGIGDFAHSTCEVIDGIP